MEQELKFIDTINRALAERKINDSRYRRVRVMRISLDRELSYLSKLDRRPELLAELRDYGIMKWRRFIKERDAWKDDTQALRADRRKCQSEMGTLGRVPIPVPAMRSVERSSPALDAIWRSAGTLGRVPKPSRSLSRPARPAREPANFDLRDAL